MADHCNKYKPISANTRAKRRSKKSNKTEIKENQCVVPDSKRNITSDRERRHLSVKDTNRGGSHSSTGDLDDSVFGGDTTSRSPVKDKGRPSVILDNNIAVSGEQESLLPPSNLYPPNVISLPEGVIDISLSEEHPEYGAEMFVYLKERETRFVLNVDYLEEGSITSNMRAVLVDWLLQVQHYLKLSQQTLYISISLLDTVLSLRDVEADKLQLVGITSLYLGSKMEEYYPADIKKLVHLTENSFTAEDVFNMELVLLSVIEFQVYVPTPADFLTQLTRAALRSSSPDFQKSCYYLIDCHLLRTSHPTLPPSYLASAAVLTASLLHYTAANTEDSSHGLKNLWTPTLEYYSGYSWRKVVPTCISMLYQVTATKLTGARTKYQSKSQHGRIAQSSYFREKVVIRSRNYLEHLLKSEL